MKSLAGLYLFNFLRNVLFFGALGVPFFLDRVHLDYTGMFILEMAFSVALFVFEIPTGIIADRYGRKVSLLAGSAILGFAFLVFGLFTNVWILLLAEILCALGMTLLSGADRALLYEVLVTADGTVNSRTVMARYDAAATAGMVVGFPAGSMLVGSGLIPYTTALGVVFLLSGMSVLLAGVVLLFVKEPARTRTGEGSLRAGIAGVRYIFEHSGLRPFAVNFAAISSLTFFVFWFYQSLVLANNLSIVYAGWAGASMNLVALILLTQSRRIEGLLGLRGMLLLSSLLPGIFYLVLAYDRSLIPACIAVYGIASLRMFRMPILQALMNEQIESQFRATVLSGVAMIERVLTALLYPVVGLLADASLGRAFLFLGGATVVFAVGLRVRRIALPTEQSSYSSGSSGS